jgi:hypothetical protein
MAVYQSTFSSDCVVLDVGCQLKVLKFVSGQFTWVDADDETNVVDGKFSDGQRCFTVSNGIITSKVICHTILSIYYEGGSYICNLYDPISASITISAFSTGVTGYTEDTCTTPSGENDNASSNIVINTGDVFASQQGTTFLTSSSTHYKFDGNLTINGTSVPQGNTIVIGGTTVTVLYTSLCTSYTP